MKCLLIISLIIHTNYCSQSQIENQDQQWLSLKDKVMVRDNSGQPEYETNLITNHTQNWDQQVADENEPISNLEMENRWQKIVYYIRQKQQDKLKTYYPQQLATMDLKTQMVRKVDGNKATQSKKQEDIDNIDNFKKYKQQMRFSESDQKVGGIRQLSYNTARFISAWASSVFSFKFMWFTRTYGASNAIRYGSYWCSAGFHPNDQVVTWQGDMDRLYRVSHVYIRWALTPNYYKLQFTQDGKVWEDKKDWINTLNSNRRTFFQKFFPQFSGSMKSYTSRVDFAQPFFAKGIRILMKKAIYMFMAIYRVEIWVDDWTVMLMANNKLKSGLFYSLSVLSGQLYNGNRLVSSELTKNIGKMDRREVFVISYNQEIFLFNNFYLCLEADMSWQKSKVIQESTRLVFKWCNEKEEQKWILGHDQEIRPKLDESYCINEGDELGLADLYDLKVKASSSAVDQQHCIEKCYDSDPNSYWLSTFNEKDVYIEFEFQLIQVIKLKIDWKYKPKQFVIKVLKQNQWISIHNQKSNSQDNHEIMLGGEDIEGITIIMNEFHPMSVVEYNGIKHYVYGISELSIETEVNKVQLQKCKSSQNQQFVVEDVFYYVDRNSLYNLEKVMNYLAQISDQLLKLLTITMQLPSKVNQYMKFGQSINDECKQINSHLEQTDINISKLKEFILEKQKKVEVGVRYVGAHEMNPALNCLAIRQQANYKKSGFYWIKPVCSQQALHVFCDYQLQRQGLDVAYYGGISANQRIKDMEFKDINDLRMVCAKIGLENVEIKTEQYYESIKRYLMNLGVTLDTNNVIPLFYDYTCQTGWLDCRIKYRSLNSIKSGVQNTLIQRNFNKAFLYILQVNVINDDR